MRLIFTVDVLLSWVSGSWLPDFLYQSFCMVESFFYFLGLTLNAALHEQFSLAKFVNIYNCISKNLQLGTILEHNLVILIIEPENIDFTCFVMFYHKHFHCCVLGFSESKFFSLDELFIAQSILFLIFTFKELFSVICDDFHLFG